MHSDRERHSIHANKTAWSGSKSVNGRMDGLEQAKELHFITTKEAGVVACFMIFCSSAELKRLVRISIS